MLMQTLITGKFINAKSVTLLLALGVATSLAGCASKKSEPNRQVAVYTGFNQVIYVPVSQYQCRSGQVTVTGEAAAGTPVADAATSGTVNLAGSRCYYADRRGRPLNGGIGVNAGTGIGVGSGNVGGGIGVGVGSGGSRGSIGVGIGNRR